MRLHTIKRLALTLSMLAAFAPAHASLLDVTFNTNDSYYGTNLGSGKLVYDFDAATQTAHVTDFTMFLSDGFSTDFSFQFSDISAFVLEVDANGNPTNFGAEGKIPVPEFPEFSNVLWNNGGSTGEIRYFPEGDLQFTYVFDAPTAEAPGADVPEPVSIGLFGIGLAGLMGARRRKV